MNKKLLLALVIFGYVVYEYYINLDAEEEDDDDKEPTLQDKIVDFLKMMGIMLGTDLFFKGLARGIKNTLAARAVSNAAKKEAAKFADKEAERLALLEEERLARAEAERLARAEAERLAKAEAERLAKLEAEALEKEAERLAETEADKLARKEAERLAQEEADKAIAKALAEAEAHRLAQIEADKLAEAETARLAEEEAARIAKVEADRLAKIEADKLIKTEADRLAKEAAEKLAKEEAEKIARAEAQHILDTIAQEQLLKLAEEELAKNGLAKVGGVVVVKAAEKEAGKMAGMLAKLAGGPFEWISFALSTALYAGLGLDSSMFKECPDDEWSFTHLPSEVLMVINAIPFFGDAWQLIGELVCFRVGKCPAGKQLSGAVCYDPCKEGYKDDGATMCYKQYGDWEKRGFPSEPTVTSVTKDVRTILGHMPEGCPPGQEFQAGLCRTACKDGYDPVLDRCWARIDTVGNGVGNVPGKKGCGDFANEGWDNCRDDGTSLWEDAHLSGGGCHHECTGDPWKTVFQAGHQVCSDHCDPIVKTGSGTIKKAVWERYKCNDNQELIGALCYDKCGPGKEKVPGMPNQCRTVGDASYERGFGDMPKCGPGTTEFEGLCYYVTPGYTVTSAGLESDPCPPGSFDFGVGCTRESYNRGAGHIAFDMHMKTRDNYYGHKDAGGGWMPDLAGMVDRAPDIEGKIRDAERRAEDALKNLNPF
jgi:hypothetical protein